MKLYDKQKVFDINKFKFLIYDSPYYSDGNFLFTEEALKIKETSPEIRTLKAWRLLDKKISEIPHNAYEMHRIVDAFAPADINDKKLITCEQTNILRLSYSKRVRQVFRYHIDTEEYIKYINVDCLEYLRVRDCIFKIQDRLNSPIVIYNAKTLKFMGLIMPTIL